MCPEVNDGFSRLDAQRKSVLTTHVRRAKDRPSPARTIRLKKGAQPDFSKLSALQLAAWHTFQGRVRRKGAVNPQLEEDLMKAHMRIRGDEYLAYTLFVTYLIALPVGLALGVLLGAFLYFVGGLGFVAFVPAAIIAVVVPVMAKVVMDSAPGSRAKARGVAIDRRISSAMSFVSAMASADVNIDTIFKELAKQKLYGEVAEEAAWITRDTELLGVDILTAIKEGAQRTPSKRFQDFLQGVVTTATSGGQLKPYFLLKADQYEKENKLDLLKRVETMGLMAETFVTVVVAFPLFLIIMIAIFAVVGSGGANMLIFLDAIVFMIPAMQAMFIFVMLAMAKEGQQ